MSFRFLRVVVVVVFSVIEKTADVILRLRAERSRTLYLPREVLVCLQVGLEEEEEEEEEEDIRAASLAVEIVSV